MNGFYLTPAQLSELRMAHKSECYKRSVYKINAVILLGSGWKLKEVREALLLEITGSEGIFKAAIRVISSPANRFTLLLI